MGHADEQYLSQLGKTTILATKLQDLFVMSSACVDDIIQEGYLLFSCMHHSQVTCTLRSQHSLLHVMHP